MGLDTIVNVTVTANTKTVSRQGFGIPLLLAYHTAWLDRYKEYSKSGFPTNMTADGFTVDDQAYKMAEAAFAQSPSVSRVVVGRRDNAWTQQKTIIPTPVAEGYVHKLTFTAPDGTETLIQVTEGAASTVAALCTSFAAAVVSGVTFADNGTDFTATVDNDAELWGFTGATASLDIQDTTADAGVAADFALVLAAYGEAYGVCLDSGSTAENKALAAAVESQKMIFVSASNSMGNGDAASTSDESYNYSNSSLSRSMHLYCEDDQAFAGAAWLGRCLPANPGFINWAFKQLNGVPASSLTDTFESAIATKRGNTYTTVAGNNITYDGKTGTSYVDIIRTTDWAEARVKESVFGGLVNADKIPFTNQGGAILEGLVLAALQPGVREDGSGAFSPDPAPYCIVPKVEDIPAADRAARNFTGIEWGAVLSGAVNTVTIRGTLSI